MKRTVTALFVILFLSCQKQPSELEIRQRHFNNLTETDTVAFKEMAGLVVPGSNINGLFVHLPALYDSTSKAYPLIISIHTGEDIGNGTTDLWKVLRNGIPKLINERKFPPSFTIVEGGTFSPIVLAPQFGGFAQTWYIDKLIDFAKKHWRIDEKRVYVTGMSMGARQAWHMALDFPSKIAAMVPMSGLPADLSVESANRFAAAGVPVWYFHNTNDSLFSRDSADMFVQNRLARTRLSPVLRYTVRGGGHDTWTVACDPKFEEEDHRNIYQWLLKYHK